VAPAVPGSPRRATLRRPPFLVAATTRPALVPVLTAMTAAGIQLGDILADAGLSPREADPWALPLRAAGAQPRQDGTRTTRWPKGTPQERRHHRQGTDESRTSGSLTVPPRARQAAVT